jgi:hypothetical protein
MPMSHETSLVERDGRVATITLNRPKALNALNGQVMTELTTAAAEFDAEPGIGAIVITGSEKAFAAGADIKQGIRTVSAGDIAPQCDSGDAPELYFICALIDLADFAVTPDRFEVVDASVGGQLAHVPVSSVYLNRVASNVDGDPAAGHLCHRGLRLGCVAIVGLAGSLLIKRSSRL